MVRSVTGKESIGDTKGRSEKDGSHEHRLASL